MAIPESKEEQKEIVNAKLDAGMASVEDGSGNRAFVKKRIMLKICALVQLPKIGQTKRQACINNLKKESMKNFNLIAVSHILLVAAIIAPVMTCFGYPGDLVLRLAPDSTIPKSILEKTRPSGNLIIKYTFHADRSLDVSIYDSEKRQNFHIAGRVRYFDRPSAGDSDPRMMISLNGVEEEYKIVKRPRLFDGILVGDGRMLYLENL